ncbi:MAG: tetratricopeptide repeat protein [Deltaproteobacteria bacterium]|nr:tetratricopeptide repeat protein [Deltaproteobacteria bacterium]
MRLRFTLLAVLALLLSACGVQVEKPSFLISDAERLSLASIYESKNEDDLAFREYRKVLKSDSKESRESAWFAIANLNLKLNNLKEAEKGYLEAIELNPSKGAYYNNLAWIYMERGEYGRAEDTAMKGLELDPDTDYMYLDTIGVIQTREEEYEDAEESLLKAASRADAANAGTRPLKEIYTHLSDLYELRGDAVKHASIRDRLKGLTE